MSASATSSCWAARCRGTRRTASCRGGLGADLDVEQGREAARLAAVNALSSIREALGRLAAVDRVVWLRGVVNATPDFTEHTRVIDAASDVLLDVFGERGQHARLALGVSPLPADLALEIEMVVQVRAASAPGSS